MLKIKITNYPHSSVMALHSWQTQTERRQCQEKRHRRERRVSILGSFPPETKGKSQLAFFHAPLSSCNVSKCVDDAQSTETRAHDFQFILWLLASMPVLCCGLTCRVGWHFSEMMPEEIMPRPMETLPLHHSLHSRGSHRIWLQT